MNEKPDARKHHWVSVSYLRPWQDSSGKKGLLEVERIKDGELLKRFKTKAENILWRRGYYDLSDAPKPVAATPSSLLEDGVFAKANEAAFLHTREKTLDQGIVPTLSQIAWLAECCLSFYYRCPRFQRMADGFYDGQKFKDWEKNVLKHHAVRTLALTIAGGVEVTKNCAFQLVEAMATTRFWTSDTPCWMWHRDRTEWKITTDLAMLLNKAKSGQTASRWLCPLTPKYLLEMCPHNENGQVLLHRQIGGIETMGYNRLILQVAENFRIRPPEAASGLTY